MNEPAPPSSGEPPAKIAAEALRFLGPIVALGGLVAMLRTRTLDPVYAALIPIGLAATAAGYWWRRGRDDEGGSRENGEPSED